MYLRTRSSGVVDPCTSPSCSCVIVASTISGGGGGGASGEAASGRLASGAAALASGPGSCPPWVVSSLEQPSAQRRQSAALMGQGNFFMAARYRGGGECQALRY